MQITVKESLILMKDLLCWDIEEVKNLKMNTRKETKVIKQASLNALLLQNSLLNKKLPVISNLKPKNLKVDNIYSSKSSINNAQFLCEGVLSV